MKTKIILGAVLALIIFLIFAMFHVFTVLDAGEVMVIQYPNGQVSVKTESGMYGQWFGTVTRYKRREQYSFSNRKDQGVGGDQSLKIQFNDGGSAKISGVVSWEMPLVPEKILHIHKEFRSQEGVDQQLIRPAIENAMFMTGPLMSSTESAGERRSELLQFITDQAQNGIYRTERIKKKIVDITGSEKEVTVSEIKLNSSGLPAREAASPLSTFSISMFPATINEIVYDPKVQSQIDKRQEQITEVQQAIAQAKKAEQQAITAAKQGEAAAAEAKWKQEVIKAQAVTQAEQERAVAELAVKTADLKKKTAELEGEGEGAKRRAIMGADGGLEKKLDAYVKVQQIWAEAFKEHQGPMVPSVVMGGNGSGANAVGSAGALVDMLTAKTAKELAVDMSIRGNTPATAPAARK
jgi:regulator of protease activity HflC (stomatin/prohibitin superfamily)